MAEDDQATESPREAHRLFKKHNWREKLRRRDAESKRQNDDAVDNFLGVSKAGDLPSPEPGTRSGPPTAPRIDVSVSQRWPVKHDLAQGPNVDGDLSVPQPQRGRSESPPRRRKPRRQGLNVKFAPHPPEIIGEGGDESDIPTQQISFARARSHSPHLENSRSIKGGAQASYTTRRYPDNTDQDVVPRVLVRQPTGLSEGRQSAESARSMPSSTQQVDYNISMGLSTTDKRLATNEDVSSNSFAGRVQAKMLAEEGVALQSGLRDLSPGPSYRSNDSDAVIRTLPTPSWPVEDTNPYDQLEWPACSLVEGSASDGQVEEGPRLPSLLPSSNQDHIRNKSPVRKPVGADSRSTRPTPRDTARIDMSQDGEGEQSPSKTQSRTPRAVAHAVSDDALAEFASGVDRFTSLFSLSAESSKPIMETSLSEWVRASVWWFLNGRGDLESAVRSRPRNASAPTSENDSSHHHIQAQVNLAKAWWIIQHIVPQHPQVRQYGNMSLSSILALVNNIGDHTIASLIETHKSLLAHLRALALSLKRNNLLPSLQGISLPQGLDTSIWVKYPNFAPDVSTMLSRNAANSMLARAPDSEVDIGKMIPLGDTSSYYCYGRMFVDVRLNSGDDDMPEYALPCILSIIRHQSDRAVKAVVTSQNELIGIVIQGDKKRGPTWQEINWQVKLCTMRLQLPRGFEITVHFQDQDFKTLWNIVEYTRKIEESRQEKPGESLIFESVLKVFHYMDPGTPKSFPPEPSKHCRLRLFEKNVAITEGTGERSAHRGFRLHLVTSSKVKTLSSINHVLAGERPIIFSYLRGDDGGPALLLQVTEAKRRRTMVLTFHEASERTEMHKKLAGVAVRSDEVEATSIPLHRFSLSAINPVATTKGFEALDNFRWDSLRAINANTTVVDIEYGATVLSEHLRICMDSPSGTVTDRVNLGMSIKGAP